MVNKVRYVSTRGLKKGGTGPLDSTICRMAIERWSDIGGSEEDHELLNDAMQFMASPKARKNAGNQYSRKRKPRRSEADVAEFLHALGRHLLQLDFENAVRRNRVRLTE